ncbi:MAG: malate synthase A [Thiogranum sp.]
MALHYQFSQPDDLQLADTPESYGTLLSDAALRFLADLHQHFEDRRQTLLSARHERQLRYDAGESPDFIPETRNIRTSHWRVAPVPDDLQDRRVEITGPVDRKMIINAMNSGANVYMADFEDSHAPVWLSTLQGHVNVIDAVRGDIELTTPEGKEYRLGENPAVLIVRPRGWHLPEKHLYIDGVPISAALFDFGLNFFHSAGLALKLGKRPYYYLPKLEHHTEARLWSDVFEFAEKALALDKGTLRATVLIETLPAVFQMEEILYQMRDYITALNCGRWDYIFSYIKTFRKHPDKVLPERGQVVMTVPFLANYSRLLIQTCHKRGALAMGGMAAQIPIKNDPVANQSALDKVRADKEREVANGHDGTWVAHPGLVPVALEIFDRHMPSPNQLDRKQEDLSIDQAALTQVPEGTITETGLRNNIEVAIEYLASWLSGNGCVPIHHLMEDAATAEISRSQLWQWINHAAQLEDGRVISEDLVRSLMTQVLQQIGERPGLRAAAMQRYQEATALLEMSVFDAELADFITLSAYETYQ